MDRYRVVNFIFLCVAILQFLFYPGLITGIIAAAFIYLNWPEIERFFNNLFR